MNKIILASVGALVVAAGSVVAFQFGDAPMDNIIVQRLEGSWTVDVPITKQLEPRPDALMPRSVQFRKDDTVLAKLQGLYPRFKLLGESLYMSGTATMNGVDHWFVIHGEGGNNKLVLFTPTREGGAGEPHPVLINLIVSRDQTKDLLFLGGVTARESATAYDRTGK